MRVQVSKWGNSTALRLPKSVVDELGLTSGSEVELTMVGQEVRLRPVRKIPVYRIEDLVAEAKRLGADNAPPLEDWAAVEAPWPSKDTPQ